MKLHRIDQANPQQRAVILTTKVLAANIEQFLLCVLFVVTHVYLQSSLRHRVSEPLTTSVLFSGQICCSRGITNSSTLSSADLENARIAIIAWANGVKFEKSFVTL